jgi:hypothetical protein
MHGRPAVIDEHQTAIDDGPPPIGDQFLLTREWQTTMRESRLLTDE